MIQFVGRRDLKESKLLLFLYHFTPAVIGREIWKTSCEVCDYSSIVTVSDEVYLYVSVENNYDKWNYKKNLSVSTIVTTMLIKLYPISFISYYNRLNNVVY